MKTLPVLHTERLQLQPASAAFARSLLRYQLANRVHFKPWDPTPGGMFYTELFWSMRLRQRAREWEAGRGLTYLLLAHGDSHTVLGTIHLANIVRGVLQGGVLAYSIDGAHEGQGLMREALQAVIAFAFGELGLHRLQANYQPDNVRSGGLLKRLGFVEEGLARDYLFIDGAWRDHVLTALTHCGFDNRRLQP